MFFAILVSSAKRYAVELQKAVGISLTKIRNNNGPRTLPWGTPERTGR